MPPTTPANPFAGLASAVSDPKLVQKIADTRKGQVKDEQRITTEQMKQTKALQQMQASMSKLRGLASAVAGVAAAGGVFGGFVRQIGAMSVEGERLGRAFELLQKVVGSGLAPYFRAVTEAVVSLAQAFNNLDPGIKETVSSVIAWGAGLSAAAGGLFVVVRVLGPVVGLVSSLASGAGALAGVLGTVVAALAAFAGWPVTIALGITALVAAVVAGTNVFSYFTDGATTMREKVAGVVETVLDVWTYFKAGTIAVWTYATEVIAKWASAVYDLIKPVLNFIGSVLKAMWEQVKALSAAVAGVGLAGARALDPAAFAKAGQAFEKALAGINGNKGLAKGIVDQVAGGLGRVQNAFANKAPMRWRVNLEFEDLQGTWDRLQKAFVSAEGQNLQQAMLGQLGVAADGIQKVANQGVNILNLPNVVN